MGEAGRHGDAAGRLFRDARPAGPADRGPAPRPLRGPADPILTLRVRDVMTSPAVCADEETDIADLCRLMWSMRINRVPIVRDGRVAGVVSSMDLCHAVCEGTLAVPA